MSSEKGFNHDRTMFRQLTGFFTARRPTAFAHADAPFRMTSFFDANALETEALRIDGNRFDY